MLILTIRTDKPEAEIGLFEDKEKLAYHTWAAHRQLAATLHSKVEELLKAHKQDWSDIKGVVVYRGPGSFTGLRIGTSFANALAESLSIPVAGLAGDTWADEGVAVIMSGKASKFVLPEYGAPAAVTAPRR